MSRPQPPDQYVELFDHLLVGMRTVRERGAGVIQSRENIEANKVIGAWIAGTEMLRARYMQLLANVTEHDLAVQGKHKLCTVIDQGEDR